MKSHDQLPFDLRSLSVFLTVCETKTMAHAAAVLRLTQPAVSQIIQDMERQLGVELFDRAMRPIELTPAGILLRQKAAILIAEARKIAPLLQSCRRGHVPLIRVGLMYSLQRLLTIPLVKVLSAAADEVVVQSGATSAHATALLTRQLDLYIGVDDLPLEAGLDRRPFLIEPYVLVTNPEWAGHDLPAVASSQPFMRYSGRTMGPEIASYLHRMGLEVRLGAEFETPYGLTQMVAEGLGWAISTPLCLIEAGIAFDRLSIRPLPRKDLSRTITLVCRHQELGRTLTQAGDVAIQTVRDRCREIFTGALEWIPRLMSFGATAASRSRRA